MTYYDCYEVPPVFPGELGPYGTLAKNFSAGDVVYGLNRPRDKALETLALVGMQRKVWIKKWFGLKKASKVGKIVQNDLTDAVWDPRIIDRVSYADDKRIRAILANWKEGISFKNFLLNHPRYNIANPLDILPSPMDYWRRTSKAGLEFHIKLGRTVHFVVDDIDVSAIASKENKEGKGQGVTSSELRWLYRHRNSFLARKFVHFYLINREVSSQEFFSKPEWNAYKPTHIYE